MSARTRNRFIPTLEILEDRVVPSGITVAVDAYGVMTITGTTGNDRITVKQTGDLLKVSGVRDPFIASMVPMIIIDGQGGNDNIQVSGYTGELVIVDYGTTDGGPSLDTDTQSPSPPRLKKGR
jgi:hypothetical protein